MEVIKYKSIYISYLITIFIFAIFSLMACVKIFEEDLTTKSVVVNMPIDNYTSSNSYLQFWWEEVEGADSYSFQIVKPSFDTIITLMVDSNVVGNKFEWSFAPGKYQWRIKACNSTSCSGFQLYSLEIDSSLDLSNSKTILISPSNNKYTNNSSIEFSWLKQYYADYYYFSVFDNNNAPIIYNKKIYDDFVYVPGQSITDTLPEGYFKWEIIAENAGSTGIKSNAYFTIDRTNPTSSTLIKPNDNSVQSSNIIDFQWISGNDLNYSYDSLLVYMDTNLITLTKSYKSTQNIITDSLTTGSYYWFVKTFDKAGNKSDVGDIRKVTIN